MFAIPAEPTPQPRDTRESGLLLDWPSRNCTIPGLFEQHALVKPNAPALLLDDGQLTYAELNERSNRLAHFLLHNGVTRGDLVGLCMERSADVLIGLLGILKAGGAYVPLDAAYPDERIAYMVRDAAVRFVVSHKATTGRLESFAGITRVLCLNALAGTIASESSAQPVTGSTAKDLAYLMYTSGSTGSPKGVLVEHRAVVRLVRETNYCDFSADQVFIHLAPLAFDASTFEVWGALLNGARLAVPRPFALTPDALAAALERHGVTTLWLTAGLFHLVTDQRIDTFKKLRQLVAGGDVLSPSHVARALEVMEHGVLINGYGPTENTTFTTCHGMKKGWQGPTVPIGRPIAHTTIYVLDEQMRLVPAGTPGELFTGGAGLARGYLNNPELTQEKFVPNPFGKDPAERLYRTGDRVQVRADGVIEFLGRVDNQLKIMGHRVEPGEIETVLLQHPSVRQVTVVARKLPRGDKQLAAFINPTNSGEFSGASLKSYLAERLPPHMVPARYITTDKFPLNHNGKVDRAQLAQLDERAQPEAPVAFAGTDLEQQIAALWSRVLGRRVGLEDNFFDAGGTSLLLLEVSAELSKLLGKSLEWTELFEHPTVRSLAARLSGVKSQNNAMTSAQERARRQKEAFARQKLARGIKV